jgi:hypothetical protein
MMEMNKTMGTTKYMLAQIERETWTGSPSSSSSSSLNASALSSADVSTVWYGMRSSAVATWANNDQPRLNIGMLDRLRVERTCDSFRPSGRWKGKPTLLSCARRAATAGEAGDMNFHPSRGRIPVIE